MKLQLNFDKKILVVENDTNLGDLMKKLKVILPDWKEWTLETKTIINYSSPIVIKEYKRPIYDWWNVMYNSGAPNMEIFNNDGTKVNEYLRSIPTQVTSSNTINLSLEG